jgi:hypothetical protein
VDGVLPSRSFTVTVCASLLGFALAGCGSDDEQPKKPAAATPSASPASPPPSYDAAQVKSSLLDAPDLHFKANSQKPNFPGLDRGAAPSCSLSRIKLPGDPEKIAQQFGSSASRFTDPNFNQLAVIYPDINEARNSFLLIQKKLDACPAKRHMPQKKISGNRITLAHDDTWKLSEDTISGWVHLRGFEKHVEPPSTSVINVYYLIYDYAMRGNVIVTSVYWQRVRPKASSDPIAKRATELLTKQLQRIG